MSAKLSELLRESHTCHQFSQREISNDLLLGLLDLVNYAPSGFNLQPWHFTVVRDESMRKLLFHLSFGQRQILDAPATVVFVANPDAWRTQYNRILQMSIERGAISKPQAKKFKRNIELFFKTSPFGIGGLWKRIGLPIRRLRRPTPNLITSAQEARAYVRAQTMTTAAMFMVAAQAEGLGTHPTEGFDEFRLKKLLHIPRSYTVPVIVTVGHPLDEDKDEPRSVRIPIQEKVSFDLFPNTLEKLFAEEEG